MRPFLQLFRISLGIVGITSLLLCCAWGLGLIPDRNGAILEGRRHQAEAMAIFLSATVQHSDNASLKEAIEEVVHRDPNILSAGVRDPNGKLTIEVGDHASQWANLAGAYSTNSEVKVPIALADRLWGTVEVRFAPIYHTGLLAPLSDSVFQLMLFLTVTSLLLYPLYLWRVLRGVLSFGGSSAVPKRIRATMDTFAEGVVILDKDQRIALANTAFAGLTGKSAAELEGQEAGSLPWVRGETEEDTASYPWQQALADGSVHTGAVLGLQTNDRRPQTLSINTTPIIGPDGRKRGALATFDNLTEIEKKNDHLRKLAERLKQSKAEIQRQNKKLEYLATRDGLTGCLNRRALIEEFETQWNSAARYGYPLSCVMVDIDYFKGVNDSHGHAVGDQVLVHVARQLEALKRSSDVLGRYGGEEFCLLLPHTDIDAAAEAAERLRKGIADSKCEPIGVTVSVGVSATSLGAPRADLLMVQADHGLYAAKRTGRNRVVRWDRIEGKEPVAVTSNGPLPRTTAASTKGPGAKRPVAEEVRQ